ncbi:MAG: CRISPR-associated protein Cst2 [Kosmotoga sp.]|nr:CRISPR-associated protein Cst2 [Kosmotoga sp.]
MSGGDILDGILQSRWAEIVDIFRVEISNINAGEGGTNDIDVKKIHLEDGTIVPRISPQSIMRMIRDYWEEVLGLPVDISKKKQTQEELEGDLKKYIDVDLFGVMLPISGSDNGRIKNYREKLKALFDNVNDQKLNKIKVAPGSITRPGPIRSIGARGIFEYPGDYDFMTSVISTTGKESGGSMITKEIYTNTFILPFWIDVPRIGRWEFNGFSVEIKDSEKKKRLAYFFDALFHLGRTGNYRSPLVPKMLVIGTYSKPNVGIYDEIMRALQVSVKDIRLIPYQDPHTGETRYRTISTGKVELDIDLDILSEGIKFWASDIERITIGIWESYFAKSAEEYTNALRESIPRELETKIVFQNISSIKQEMDEYLKQNQTNG